mmetsp:Transcript_49123/g.130053  ORF Transcript_49123/g.130053 Transcript_49123/m.130053 type:complete len:201 (-) Transcript_49123:514-1116(-)
MCGTETEELTLERAPTKRLEHLVVQTDVFELLKIWQVFDVQSFQTSDVQKHDLVQRQFVSLPVQFLAHRRTVISQKARQRGPGEEMVSLDGEHGILKHGFPLHSNSLLETFGPCRFRTYNGTQVHEPVKGGEVVIDDPNPRKAPYCPHCCIREPPSRFHELVHTTTHFLDHPTSEAGSTTTLRKDQEQRVAPGISVRLLL